jgi:O-antigen ligase
MEARRARGKSGARARHSVRSAAAERRTPLLLLVLLAGAVVFGGASAPASWGGIAVQLLSCAILAAALLRAPTGAPAPPPGWGWVGWGVLALVLAQLMPLPPTLWAALPGRALASDSFALAGLPLPVLPLSLAPSATVSAALTGLPVLALAGVLVRPGALDVARVSALVVALALVSWAIGVLQVVGGQDSALYFHAITNRGSAVGFFANANHLALLLAICVPLVAALVGTAHEQSLRRRYAPLFVIGYAGLAALGITLTGSVAGIILLAPAVAASLFIAPGGGKARAGTLFGSLAAAGLAAMFSIGVLGTSFEDGQGSRPEIWRTTSAGIAEFWPVGGGLGSFPSVYPAFENADAVGAKFINHAHNDYLEVLFEAGLPGALLIAAVVGWWGLQSHRAWRRKPVENAAWRRAGSVVVGLALAHSLVDYPLRTPAILLIVLVFAAVLSPGSSSIAPQSSAGSH